MPEKTPLNAKITGVLKKENYQVEKLVFESIPGYYVTAALFIPKKRKGKIPAIIYACGHTINGFRSPVYQRVVINLVMKGFAVLTFDPIVKVKERSIFVMDMKPSDSIVLLWSILIPDHNVTSQVTHPLIILFGMAFAVLITCCPEKKLILIE